MKKMLLIVLILCLASTAYARNICDVWKSMDSTSKSGMVVGFVEGYGWGFHVDRNQNNIPQGQKDVMRILSNIDILTMVSEIDKFYSNEMNYNIPFGYAILHIVSKIDGISEKEAQKDLEIARKHYSENKNTDHK